MGLNDPGRQRPSDWEERVDALDAQVTLGDPDPLVTIGDPVSRMTAHLVAQRRQLGIDVPVLAALGRFRRQRQTRGGGPQRFHSFNGIYGFYSKSADCRTLNTLIMGRKPEFLWLGPPRCVLCYSKPVGS